MCYKGLGIKTEGYTLFSILINCLYEEVVDWEAASLGMNARTKYQCLLSTESGATYIGTPCTEKEEHKTLENAVLHFRYILSLRVMRGYFCFSRAA